ncbi:MAG: LytTR family DNA-binding domain-containing protein [Rhodoferax sp.]|nr:LytTR family DNA-binding domain-containing protein [Rhodoferax sp.]
MTVAPAATALIAEDESLLASALQAELARAWPNLQVLAIAGDGLSAVQLALHHRPDVLFFDIRMPGQSGLDAAAELADRWDDSNRSGKPFPALVFITAYDQYAVQAFEAQAMDYLQKPLQHDRLQRAVGRLQAVLAARSVTATVKGGDTIAGADTMEHTLAQLRALLAAGATSAPALRLSVIQVSVGNSIRMVPLEEVVYFEAADKYIRVLTAEHEYLIRTPLRELLPQLDPQQFWQVHRATVVSAQAVLQVTRDEAGKLWLHLRGRREKLPVSRLYAHLFKAM